MTKERFTELLNEIPEVRATLEAADRVSESMGLTLEQYEFVRAAALLDVLQRNDEVARLYARRMMEEG